MLMTLLVLWVIVVPVLTIAGTYVMSGLWGRRLRARASQAQRVAPDHLAAVRAYHSVTRIRRHTCRTRPHTLARH